MSKKIYYILSILIIITLIILTILIKNDDKYYKIDITDTSNIDTSKWNIPSYLNEKRIYEIYTNDKSNKEYEIILSNEDKNINIKILNSEKDNEDTDNIELDIYSDNNNLIASFILNNKRYIIETDNIEKEELLELVKSIIKE